MPDRLALSCAIFLVFCIGFCALAGVLSAVMYFFPYSLWLAVPAFCILLIYQTLE